jgi:hypothetical protein
LFTKQHMPRSSQNDRIVVELVMIESRIKSGGQIANRSTVVTIATAEKQMGDLSMIRFWVGPRLLSKPGLCAAGIESANDTIIRNVVVYLVAIIICPQNITRAALWVIV